MGRLQVSRDLSDGGVVSTTGAACPAASALGGLGAGIGLRMRDYRADYTFAPFGELGNAQRISLGAQFGRQ